MGFTEDLRRFAFGGDSNTFSIYELTNNTYELVRQDSAGELVLEVMLDLYDYYLIVELSGSIQTYYRCPEECQSCFFPLKL